MYSVYQFDVSKGLLGLGSSLLQARHGRQFGPHWVSQLIQDLSPNVWNVEAAKKEKKKEVTRSSEL